MSPPNMPKHMGKGARFCIFTTRCQPQACGIGKLEPATGFEPVAC